MQWFMQSCHVDVVADFCEQQKSDMQLKHSAGPIVRLMRCGHGNTATGGAHAIDVQMLLQHSFAPVQLPLNLHGG